VRPPAAVVAAVVDTGAAAAALPGARSADVPHAAEKRMASAPIAHAVN